MEPFGRFGLDGNPRPREDHEAPTPSRRASSDRRLVLALIGFGGFALAFILLIAYITLARI